MIMAKQFDETEHPRTPGGEFANKNGKTRPGELPTETVADPAAAFESELAEKLNQTYPDRTSVLDAAKDLETYEGGINISRKGEGWGIGAADVSGFTSCDLPYDSDGNPDYKEVDFGQDEPDDYRICNTMNCDRWTELQPVKDFMDGKTDTLQMYSVMPAGYLQDAGDDEDDYVDSSYLTCLCANKGDSPEWHSQFQDLPHGNDLVETIQNNINTSGGKLTAWPDSTDGSIIIGRTGENRSDRLNISLNDKGKTTVKKMTPIYSQDWLIQNTDTIDSDEIQPMINHYLKRLAK